MLKTVFWFAVRIPKLIRYIFINPRMIGEIIHYIGNDIKALLGFYRYDYQLIFVAGMAKSGTTWVHNTLAKVPGYNIRVYIDRQGITEDWNIDDEILGPMPKNRYTVLKLHTRYSQKNLECILRHTPVLLVTIRDLRDIVISRYYHVKSLPHHRHYRLYNKLSLEEGIGHSLEVIGKHFVPWVMDWYRVASEHPDKILLVKYEELHSDSATTFRRIFAFFHLPVTQEMAREFERSKLKKEVSIKEGVKKSVGLRTQDTSRKGGSGDWRNHFTEAQKVRFKELAGNDLVILGYEKDLNW